MDENQLQNNSAESGMEENRTRDTEKDNTAKEQDGKSYFDGTTLQLIGWRFLGSLVSLITLGLCTPWAFTIHFYHIRPGSLLRFCHCSLSLRRMGGSRSPEMESFSHFFCELKPDFLFTIEKS